MCEDGLSRASFLIAVAGAAAAAAIPVGARASSAGLQPREIWVVDAHTGRELRAYLTLDGTHLWRGTPRYPGYDDLCYLLRDTHQNIEAPISVMLLEIMFETQAVLRSWGYNQPIVATSGFRTVETNSAVGGARYSYHERVPCAALDMYVPDTPLELVWRAAASRAYTGGLGWYPGSHVHIDAGPRRYWRG